MKVTSVRKDKMGCKIDDKWYMFSPAVKSFVADKELYQAEVEIEVSADNKIINKITIKSQGSQGNQGKEGISKDDYWAKKEARDIMREKKISLHGALNSAMEAVKLRYTMVPNKDMTVGDLLVEAEAMAQEQIKPWLEKNM